jgi:5,10-methylenetetrahydromethanopterin reductase
MHGSDPPVIQAMRSRYLHQSRISLTGSAGEVAAKLAAFATAGVTEVAYQPAGPDIPRELRAFASAAGLPAS